jgi:RNA-directed DNA polymerase
VLKSVTRWFERKLKLVIGQEKSKIVTGGDIEYLGFMFKNKRITWTNDSLENFKHNIRRLTARSWGISMEERITRLSDYIGGWRAYFALSELYHLLPELDEWIRRRVRMCYIKRWRRTRIRNLISLGAVTGQTIAVGLSSKGPWKLARTFGSQSGLINAYLTKQGLVSMRELWIAFHYPKRTTVNRRMRTRMSGGVGRAGLKPALTRLCFLLHLTEKSH